MGRTILIEHNIPWLPAPSQARTMLSGTMPPVRLSTSALALAFQGDRLLMTDLVRRGWDIPGGHIEQGEKPEATLRREVYEETAAHLGSIKVLGHQHIHLAGPVPERYPYPYPDSYQVFFWAQVAALDEFLATEESRGRALFSPDEAIHIPWVRDHYALYEAALHLARTEVRST